MGEIDDEDLDDFEEEQPPRKKTPSQLTSEARTRAQQDAAEVAGKDAYALELPYSACPFANDHPLYLANHWHFGWGTAWFAATGAKGVKVYSQVQAGETDPGRIGDLWRASMQMPHFGRAETPPLPWTMPELVGSWWWNIHTYTTQAVTKLFIDRWGRPELSCGHPFSMDDSMPDRERYHHTLGIYMEGERYIIEHWVRGDLWDPQTTLVWYLARVARQREAVLRSHATARDADSRNKNLKQEQALREHEALQTAIAEAQAYATENGLVIDPNLINAHAADLVKRGAVESVQLQLL